MLKCLRRGCSDQDRVKGQEYDIERLQRRLVQWKMVQTILCFFFLPFMLLTSARTTAHSLWTTIVVILRPTSQREGETNQAIGR